MKKLLLAMILVLPILTACEDDHLHPHQDHFDAIGVALFHADTLVASILRGQSNDTLLIGVGETGDKYIVRFYDHDEHIIEADDHDVIFAWEISDATMLQVVQDAGRHGTFEFRLHGLQPGITSIELFIMHDDHADFRSGLIPVRIH